jgi:hypothetical protein
MQHIYISYFMIEPPTDRVHPQQECIAVSQS